MNKYFKSTIIFVTGVVSGFGLCGGLIFKKVLDSDDLRELIKKKISKRILNSIYGVPNYKSYYKKSVYYHIEEEPVFGSRVEANKVLDDMIDILEKYGVVTVADFHDLCDITGNYTDNLYGWVNLKKAEIIRIRAGYKISLPLAIRL